MWSSEEKNENRLIRKLWNAIHLEKGRYEYLEFMDLTEIKGKGIEKYRTDGQKKTEKK